MYRAARNQQDQQNQDPAEEILEPWQ
jgi:hypothetical protein